MIQAIKGIARNCSSIFSTFFVARFYKRIKSGKGTRYINLPNVLVHRKARIKIGDNTTINSSNFGYHINMHSSCKLYADRAGAEIVIGNNCRIHGTCIHAYRKITIGDNCLIAGNCQIIDGNGHLTLMNNPKERINSQDEGAAIVIEDNVWIAAGCYILGGTVIGQGSIITAGSIVKGIIPPNSIFGGNPATLIKTYIN